LAGSCFAAALSAEESGFFFFLRGFSGASSLAGSGGASTITGGGGVIAAVGAGKTNGYLSS